MNKWRANAAVAVALGPICAAKFFAQGDAIDKFAELKKLALEYAQLDFIQKGDRVESDQL